MAFAVDNAAATEMLVSAGLCYEVIAAACSSPQTAEINAQARADTLMKWVKLGIAQAVLFTAIAVAIQMIRKRPVWPVLLGAGVAIGLLWWQYQYALACGLRDGGPPTEHYAS